MDRTKIESPLLGQRHRISDMLEFVIDYLDKVGNQYFWKLTFFEDSEDISERFYKTSPDGDGLFVSLGGNYRQVKGTTQFIMPKINQAEFIVKYWSE